MPEPYVLKGTRTVLREERGSNIPDLPDHFYTGKGEKNELKENKYCTAYAVAWELMDSIAEEINNLRKQNGLPELSVDHSICFINVGAKDPKVDSVFDNAIYNISNHTAFHTFGGKTIKAECLASGFAQGEEIIFEKEYDKSTLTIACITVGQWYKSVKGHKEIIMGKNYKTMGILVIISDKSAAMNTYAIFK